MITKNGVSVASMEISSYFAPVLKRLAIGVVLFTMMLHGAARLGILSYAYEQRYKIAFALGFIEEMPMTMCSHEYYADDGLVLQGIDQGEQTPISSILFTSHEIHLFLNTFLVIPAPAFNELAASHRTGIIQSEYLSPTLSIFHPPC